MDNGVRKVRMQWDGEPIGDTLDDNRYLEDHYRFHDVLRLANAAVLAWSATFRALLGRKRKQDDQIERVEDGGRGIAIEESLVAYVFSEAGDVSYFEGMSESAGIP